MKKSTLILFGVLMVMMSSCVYSLFPIYTDDTLVFKKELLGKWKLNEEDYLLFERNKEEDEAMIIEEPKYSLEIKDGFTMTSSEPIFIEKNGERIYDEDRIREEVLRALEKDEALGIKSKGATKSTFQDKKVQGTMSVSMEKSYKLTVYQNDKYEYYIAHLVEIGDDLFMDLYPAEVEFDSEFSMNLFPVHTFMKVNLRGNKLDMTAFDLEKLNKLFESNLIRLRHENVDGTILITAQPKELQKFLEKYSEDESVFEDTENYSRAS